MPGRRLLVLWACEHCRDIVACIWLWAANCCDSGLILCTANVIKILACYCFKRFAPICFSLACTEKLKAQFRWKKYWIILFNQIKAYTDTHGGLFDNYSTHWNDWTILWLTLGNRNKKYTYIFFQCSCPVRKKPWSLFYNVLCWTLIKLSISTF